MTSTDVHSLSGAFVLHALSERESERFKRHVASCATCAQEVAELRQTVTRLADDTWTIPPARLRAKVMARIKRMRQDAPALPKPRWISLVSLTWPRRATMAVAIAAGLCAVVTIGYLTQQLQRQETIAAQANTHTSLVQKILSAPGAAIRSTPVNGGGTMTVIAAPAHRDAVVILAGLHHPGADQAYQLWLINGSTAISAAVLDTGHSTATRIVTAIHDTDLIGLTTEPAGGSSTPTLPVLAQIRVK